MPGENITIANTTNGKLPRLPFVQMKEAVLGVSYELSLVFIGDKRSKTLNQAYRGKSTPASILSFPLDTRAGEIYINLTLAKRRQNQYGMTHTQLVGYLFIHGLLHLKGLDHGSTMDRREKELCTQFKIPFTSE